MSGFIFPQPEQPDYKEHDPQGEYAKKPMEDSFTINAPMKSVTPNSKDKMVVTPEQAERNRERMKVRQKKNLSDRIM